MNHGNINVLLIDEDAVNLTLLISRCLGMKNRYNVYSVAFEPKNQIVYKKSKYFKKCIVSPCDKDEEKIKILNKIFAENQIHIILPIKEKTVRFIQSIRNSLPLTIKLPFLPSPQHLNIVTNKFETNEFLSQHGFNNPVTMNVSDAVQKEVRFPALLKPQFGAGGTGIYRVNSSTEMMKLMKELREDYIFQEMLQGEDRDISLYAKEGKIIFYTMQAGVRKKGYQYSRGIQFFHNEEFLDEVSKIIHKMNYSGIAHLDFIYNKECNKYYLVDFNARFWSSILGSLNVGVNFPDLICRDALNENYTIPDFEDDLFYMPDVAINKILADFNVSYVWRRSQLKFICKDPLPELFYLIKNPFMKNRHNLNLP